MDQPKRKHRKTGAPRGGARSGAGRTEGSTNALGLGEVRAVKAAGLRVPDGAPKEQRELANEALGTIIDVMRGSIGFVEAPMRLKASAHIREEICGPVAKQVNLAGNDGGPLQVSININRGKT